MSLKPRYNKGEERTIGTLKKANLQILLHGDQSLTLDENLHIFAVVQDYTIGTCRFIFLSHQHHF